MLPVGFGGGLTGRLGTAGTIPLFGGKEVDLGVESEVSPALRAPGTWKDNPA
jgi:hypothetical protein